MAFCLSFTFSSFICTPFHSGRRRKKKKKRRDPRRQPHTQERQQIFSSSGSRKLKTSAMQHVVDEVVVSVAQKLGAAATTTTAAVAAEDGGTFISEFDKKSLRLLGTLCLSTLMILVLLFLWSRELCRRKIGFGRKVFNARRQTPGKNKKMQ